MNFQKKKEKYFKVNYSFLIDHSVFYWIESFSNFKFWKSEVSEMCESVQILKIDKGTIQIKEGIHKSDFKPAPIS
jgi:hypothetical protein